MIRSVADLEGQAARSSGTVTFLKVELGGCGSIDLNIIAFLAELARDTLCRSFVGDKAILGVDRGVAEVLSSLCWNTLFRRMAVE